MISLSPLVTNSPIPFNPIPSIPVKPFINNYLHLTVELTLSKLIQQESNDLPQTRVQCYSVIGSLLFYDVEATMRELEGRQAVQKVVLLWIADGSEIERWSAKKATVLGWLGMLSLGIERLVRNGVDPSALFRGAIEMAKALKDDYEGGGNEEGESDDNDNMNSGEADFASNWDNSGTFASLEGDEDGDVDLHNNQEYMKLIRGGNADDPNFLGYGGFLGGEWDDDDEDEDFESPLDDVNELIVMEQVFNQLSASEPQAFEALKGTLPQETIGAIGDLYAAAQAAKAEAAAKAASA